MSHAIPWCDSTSENEEEEERASQELSGTDRQDVNNATAELSPTVIQDVSNAAAEPSSCVSHSLPTSSFGRVLKPTRRYIEEAKT